MAFITRSILISAPVEQVFTFLSCWQNLPRFSKTVAAVQNLDCENKRGAHIAMRRRGMLDITPDETMISEYVEMRSFRLSSCHGPLWTEQYKVEPYDTDTRLTYSLEYEPPAPMGGLIDALVGRKHHEQDVDESLRRLKCLMECGDCPPGMCDD